MIRFYKVEKGGRQCLPQQKKLKHGDIICASGNFMLKVATPTSPTSITSMFASEPGWITNIENYIDITDNIKILRKLIPHLTNGKKFPFFSGNVKKEVSARVKETTP